jgi:predicted kinase
MGVAPFAVLVAGQPGAGKSTVGRALADRLGAALVDQDTVTGPLVAVVAGLVGVQDLDDPRLAGPTRDARYEAIVAIAEENLGIGTPVVLVAPFTRERRDPEAWRALAARLQAAGGRPLLVWLQLAPETAIRRLRARGAARDLAKLADATSFLASLDPSPPRGPHLSVNAEGSPDDVVEYLVNALIELAEA